MMLDLFDAIYNNSLENVKVLVYNEESESIIKFIVPGLDKEDISIKVDEDILKVVGVNKKDSEIITPDFSRKFKLLNKYNTEGITAQLKDGVLVIKIPLKESIEEKQIKID